MNVSEYNYLFDKFKQYAFSHNLFSVLGIHEKDEDSITSLVDCMLNYRTADYHNCKNRILYLFELSIALLLYKLRYCINQTRFIREKVLLVETTDRYNNLKIINDVYSDSAYIFFPIFKFKVQDSAIHYLRTQNIAFYHVPYSIVDVFSFFIFSIRNFNRINSFIKDVRNNTDSFTSCNKVYDCLLKLIFYKRILGRVEWRNKIILWRYDMNVEHLALYLTNRNNSISVGVNHGSFIGFNIVYTRSFSDYQMCVSEREKRDIIKYGRINPGHVFAIGGPLQLFSQENTGVLIERKESCTGNGLLVLLTTATDELLKRQIDVLKLLGIEYYSTFTCRFRPASYNRDLEALRPYMPQNAMISTNKYLIDDVDCCNAVISFSLDAFPMCYDKDKRCFLYIQDDSVDFIKTDSFVVSNSLGDLKDYLRNSDMPVKKDKNIDGYYMFNFGECRKSSVLSNITKVFNKIITNDTCN